ncbi:MAG: DciA family protein [Pseudomonadota bacterium]
MTRDRGRLPKAIGTFVPAAVGETARRHGFVRTEVIAHWREIVGPDFADICRPERLTRGRDGATLTVRVPQGRLLDLSYATDLLRDRLTSVFGSGAIVRIRLEPGDITSQPAPSRPAETRPAPPAELSSRLDRIEDPGLRDALVRLGGYQPTPSIDTTPATDEVWKTSSRSSPLKKT